MRWNRISAATAQWEPLKTVKLKSDCKNSSSLYLSTFFPPLPPQKIRRSTFLLSYSSRSKKHGQFAHSPAASEQGEVPTGHHRNTPGVPLPCGRRSAGGTSRDADPRAAGTAPPPLPVQGEGQRDPRPRDRRPQGRQGPGSRAGPVRHTGPCAGPFPPRTRGAGRALCAGQAGAARARCRPRLRRVPPARGPAGRRGRLWPGPTTRPPLSTRTHRRRRRHFPGYRGGGGDGRTDVPARRASVTRVPRRTRRARRWSGGQWGPWDRAEAGAGPRQRNPRTVTPGRPRDRAASPVGPGWFSGGSRAAELGWSPPAHAWVSAHPRTCGGAHTAQAPRYGGRGAERGARPVARVTRYRHGPGRGSLARRAPGVCGLCCAPREGGAAAGWAVRGAAPRPAGRWFYLVHLDLCSGKERRDNEHLGGCPRFGRGSRWGPDLPGTGAPPKFCHRARDLLS